MTAEQLMPPTLTAVNNSVKTDVFTTLNCCNIGQIETVTASEQTVEVSLQIKRLAADGTSTALPILVDCPYFVLQGGGAYIDMPITKGDYCLVLFNDRDIDTWWDTANKTDPNTTRKHSLSDGIALVGINPKPQALDNDGSQVRILGTDGAGSEAEAARKGDATQISATTDSAFIKWMSLVSAAANIIAPGSITTIPTTVTGEITGGSTGVKIG